VLVDDLGLYLALAVGWLVGRRWPSRSPWVARTTLAAVVVLVGVLGASFRDLGWGELSAVLPEAILFALLLLGATLGAYWALARRATADGARPASPPPAPSPKVPTSALLLVALFGGYAIGRSTSLPATSLIPWVLAALLALVGYGLDLRWRAIGTAWLPLSSAAVGAVGASVVFALLGRISAVPTLGTAMAFGWYSLAGPLVTARFGASVGLFAFLANFAREALVMLLAPYVGRSVRGGGLAALGGATSMDTTLYFVVRYGDPDAGAMALATGLTLTIAASLLVPAVLAL
jgi:uncharacterized membrane protein YbjE (DUF340 family)